MRFRIPPLYKKVLMITLVAGPFIWLMFTEDGQRRSDLVILWLLDKPEFNVAFEQLNSSVSEDDVREQFSKIDWQCRDGANPFGDRLCASELASFNGIPGQVVTLFYAGGKLRALRIDYRARYHDMLSEGLHEGLGGPERDLSLTPPVLSWRAGDGQILFPGGEEIEDSDASLMWLSGVALRARGQDAAPAGDSEVGDLSTHSAD